MASAPFSMIATTGLTVIQYIPQSSYQKMPWKNKKGSTSQIFLSPEGASLDKLDFDFRLSSAPVVENTVFSKFTGFKRILFPIKGKGFSLNGALYELNEVAYFEGSEETHCELVQGEVLDLGLIYKPDALIADAKVLQFKGLFKMNAESQTQYLVYILRGALSLNTKTASEHDTFFVDKEAELTFESSKNTMMVVFSISKKMA